MISFVWSSKYPFLAGTGGSENYTAGHMRELQRRGIATRLITFGDQTYDVHTEFPEINHLHLDSIQQLSDLNDTLVFVTYPLDIKTKHPAYAILHCPPPNVGRGDPLYNKRAFRNKRLIVPSRYAASLWRKYLGPQFSRLPVVYPFAEDNFMQVPRRERGTHEPMRILFAGRITPDKGIYTLLAALHMEALRNHSFTITTTDACAHSEDGELLLPLLQAHPRIHIEPRKKNPEQMAQLMARHDIVVMPSTAQFWQELFGIVSVEAQHAGCRVVASRSGGLPETNCGGLIVTQPDNPLALAQALSRAIQLGPLNVTERKAAAHSFTIQQSVDALLKQLGYQPTHSRRPLPRLQPQLSLFSERLRMTRPIH